ncbi:hypothetical protein A1O3_08395 [Capronia epimyces CBS 606.96]|uniref:Bacteriophage T5 Orf172 DNA-binding domain-containing protein n=1 Tax=Capronia epimyces CBS 606.96 TaxID=1182542 RepID=W9XNL3_9EURO|nr:uncharacterized protein A1O3_08395 [Capronia epimyces CBS 606.96]EXJ78895.1 hypothetical protein A1O3_08395 [Capronia epimyces CBS 606.96]
MASPRHSRTGTPKGWLVALQAAQTFETPRASHLSVRHDDHTSLSPPTTPGLGWDKTPPAIEDAPTPEYELGKDDGALPLPVSPLDVRKTGGSTSTSISVGQLAIHDNDPLELNDSHRGDQTYRTAGGGGLFWALSNREERRGKFSDTQHGINQGGYQFPTANFGFNSTATSAREALPSQDRARECLASEVKVETDEHSATTTSTGASDPEVAGSNEASISKRVRIFTAPYGAAGVKTENTIFRHQATSATGDRTTANTETPTSTAVPAPSSVKRTVPVALVWSLNTTLSSILPLETVERLQSDPLRCIATSADQSSRCKNQNAGKLTQEKAFGLLKGHRPLNRPFDPSDVANRLLALMDQATCKHQHRKPSQSRWDELCSYSWRVDETEDADRHTVQAAATMAAGVVQVWLEALMKLATRNPNGKARLREEDGPSVQQTLASSVAIFTALDRERTTLSGHVDRGATATSVAKRPGPDREDATTNNHNTGSDSVAVVVKQDLGAPKLSYHLNYHFERYTWAGKKNTLSASELIRQTLMKPLTEKDLTRTGSIYVFWHPGNFGYVKIGRSADIKERLNQWRRQCKYVLEPHTPTPDDPTEDELQAHHPHRIETLIQAELKEHRLLGPPCKGCKHQHSEWFEVSSSYALQVAKKWTSRSTSLYKGRYLYIEPAEIDRLCQVTAKDSLQPAAPPRLATKGAKLSGTKKRQNKHGGRKSSPL